MNKYQLDLQNTGLLFLRAAAGLLIATELFALGVLSFLGTFTRYLADDYCEILNVRNGPLISAIFQNYMNGRIRAANRFSHLLLVGWSEMLGRYNIQFIPGLMIVIWLIGLMWSIHGVRKLAGIRQPIWLDWLLAIMLVFFSALQAPNRFQTFFWRSSVTTHFAPVVFIFLLSGFIIFQSRSAPGRLPAFWAGLIVFIMSFLIGGISEPPTVVLFVVTVLCLLYTWRQRKASVFQPGLPLLFSCLGGTFLALCALFFAPGNQLHGKMSFSILPRVIIESAWFSVQFVRDTFLTLPMPTVISILISSLIFFCLYISPEAQTLSFDQKHSVKNWLMFVPLLHFLLITASFAPSAYGQDYPVERARFLGCFLMTSALIFEGALLGVWFAQVKQLFAFRNLVLLVAGVALLVLGIYPLRAGFSMLSEIESYKSWASAWDEREANIRALSASGEQDLVVRWLPNRYRVKDIDGSVDHWMNRCVSLYYDINSIRSVPMDK